MAKHSPDQKRNPDLLELLLPWQRRRIWEQDQLPPKPEGAAVELPPSAAIPTPSDPRDMGDQKIEDVEISKTPPWPSRAPNHSDSSGNNLHNSTSATATSTPTEYAEASDANNLNEAREATSTGGTRATQSSDTAVIFGSQESTTLRNGQGPTPQLPGLTPTINTTGDLTTLDESGGLQNNDATGDPPGDRNDNDIDRLPTVLLTG